MNHDLIERYVYAVTRRMPKAKREDVSQELRGLIDDMLLERCGERRAEEKDIRIVLIELGDPVELYGKYCEEEETCLIGQPYYAAYKMVMGVVWVSVAVGMAVASLILMAIGQWTPGEMLGNFLANTIQGLSSAFSIITLLFAYFYRKNIDLKQYFSFDDLPPVPKKGSAIPKWECYASIAFILTFVITFLLTPQIYGVVQTGTGQWVPIFERGSIQNSWYILVLFAVCGVAREVVKLMEGEYNQKVMLTSIGANFLSAVLGSVWILFYLRITAEWPSVIGDIFADSPGFLVSVFDHFHDFFLGCILFALAMDTAEAVYKTVVNHN